MTVGESPHIESQEGTSSSRCRLHISPFTPTQLPTVIPSSIRPETSNITYHTLQTFPERSYGFVEVRRPDAEKIKKRLHGSILKGVKVQVEEARSQHSAPSMAKGEEAKSEDTVEKKYKTRSSKRDRKQARHSLPGVDLPSGRKVERGWTQSTKTQSKDKKRSKSKKGGKPSSTYTTEAECLFRTTLPPNVEPKGSGNGMKRSKHGSAKPTVIHEFSRTTKHPAFLRDQKGTKDAKRAASYVENKGWVDEEGNVVEEASTPQKKRKRPAQPREAKVPDLIEEAASDQAPSNGQRHSSTSDTSQQETEDELSASIDSEHREESDAPTSSSELPSDGEDGHVTLPKNAISSSSSKKRKQPLESSAPDLSIKIPSNDTSRSSSKQVHPLEALFKRPVKKGKGSSPAPEGPIEPENAFSFFEPDDEEDTVLPNPPHTPYTRRDLQDRALRSAAPTPDTAAPGKGFPRFWTENTDEDSDSEGVKDREDVDAVGVGDEGGAVSGPLKKAHAQPTKQGSTQRRFEESFWERRGESNRIWKRRRREAGKEKRKRENQRLRGAND